MECLGQVLDGKIVLMPPVTLPEGARVRVTLEMPSDPLPEGDGPTLYEQFQRIIGKAHGLPNDLAEHHDHYVHGLPKAQPPSSP